MRYLIILFLAILVLFPQSADARYRRHGYHHRHYTRHYHRVAPRRPTHREEAPLPPVQPKAERHTFHLAVPKTAPRPMDAPNAIDSLLHNPNWQHEVPVRELDQRPPTSPYGGLIPLNGR